MTNEKFINTLIMLCQCFFFEHNYILYINYETRNKKFYKSLSDIKIEGKILNFIPQKA